jgi:2'-5' RNA ligase
MSTERLFIALQPPPAERNELFRYAADLASECSSGALRPMKEENLHITLHFLGNTEMERVDELRMILRRVAGSRRRSSLSLETNDAGFFPSKRKPRVLQVAIKPTDALTELHEALGNALRETGFPVEVRRYRPHITLAKIGRRTSSSDVEAIRRHVEVEAPPPGVAFSIGALRLVASELTPQGSIYTDLEVVEFDR